jgi:hypothetical protein
LDIQKALFISVPQTRVIVGHVERLRVCNEKHEEENMKNYERKN